MSNIYKKIKDLIIDGELAEAIELLSSIVIAKNDKLENEITLLSARNNRNERDKMNSLVEDSRYKTEFHQIIVAIQYYLGKVEKKYPVSEIDDIPKPTNNNIPQITNLTGSQYENFMAALGSAYPTIVLLKQFARFKLDLNLDTIASNNNLNDTTFSLIGHFEAIGKLNLLIEKAHQDKSQNPLIAKFVQSL